MKTSLIYVRRASSNQSDEKTFAIKKTKCIEFAKKLHYKVLGIYADLGVSGNTLERKALKELLRISRYKRVDTIIVFSLDQLSRNAANFIKICVAFEKNNIQILSVTEGNISASPITKYLSSVTQYLSESER